MTFYQELQLSSAGSKQLIKNTTDKKEKWRHILIYNFKVYLVMAFCVAVVTLYTKLTGQENSVAGVTVLLALLVLRFWHTDESWIVVHCGNIYDHDGWPATGKYGISGGSIFYKLCLYPASYDFWVSQCHYA